MLPSNDSSESRQPLTTEHFERALQSLLHGAEQNRLPFIDVRSGDLHGRVGQYPGPNHRMPICCNAMRKFMRSKDEILEGPPRGNGANLVIRYYLPRLR